MSLLAIEAGINLFSVHQELGQDYFGTLEKIADAGYKNLELIGINMRTFTRYIDEIPAEKLGEKLKGLGMQAVLAHEMLNPGAPIDSHDWESVMRYYEKLDCRSIVVSSLWVKDREDTMRVIEQINRVGKRMHEQGFSFYLHNHAHEFKWIGNESIFDLLINNTDPDFVRFELDLVWVMRAGLDHLEILDRLGNRCDVIHQKDISPTTAYPLNLFEATKQDGIEEWGNFFGIYQKYTVPEDHADLGSGVFDFDSTYKRIREKGNVRYAIVENEGASQNKLRSVANDLKTLRRYL